MLAHPENETTSTWLDLVIYIFGGFGLFALASFGVGLLFIDTEPNLLMISLAILLNVIFIGGSVYFLGVLRGKTSWEEMGLIPIKLKWEWILLAIGLAVGLMPLRALVGLIFQLVIEGNFDSLQARADIFSPGTEFSWPYFLVTLIGAGILGPISEELYFRGLIHRWFMPRLGFTSRVLASSIFFGLGHIDSVGVLASSFIMGIVLAVVYEKTESLWVPIAIHIFTNSIAVTALYFFLAIGEYLP